jgi:uncharacterized membrane protein (TIGR02234 family)
VVVGAGLMLLAVSRPWVHAVVDDALAGRLDVQASGRQAAPLVAAVALVALAGAVALLTLRTVGRVVAGLLLVLSGAAAGAAAVDVLRTPSDALRTVVADATGRSGDALPVAQQTSWPWVAVVGGVLVVLGGALAVVRARRWAGLSGRYDAPVGASARARRPPGQVTDAGEPGADVPELESGRPSDAGGTQPDVEGRAVDADPWDRLSRGEDPTV